MKITTPHKIYHLCLKYFRILTKNNRSIFAQKNYWIKYTILLIGVIFLYLVIYIKFLHFTVPREIPFSLSFYGWLMLFFICSSYLYVIIRLLYPKPILPFVVKIVSYISKRFVMLDLTIKNNKYIHLYYIRIKETITADILLTNTVYRILLIYLFIIISGTISLLIFIYDVFIINRIEIFYYFIFLNILPMFYAYYNYSLIIIKEEYLSELLHLYDEVHIYDKSSEFKPFGEENPDAIYHDKFVLLKESFNIQLKERYKEPENYTVEYYGILSDKEYIFEKYRVDHNKVGRKLNSDDYDKIDKKFYLI